MALNQDNFDLLQLGKNPDLKHPYILLRNLPLCVREGVTFLSNLHTAVRPRATGFELCQGRRVVGVFIDPELSWKEHISRKVKKTKVMASWMLRAFRARDI